MGAVDRYSLIVESVTKGEAELGRHAAAVTGLAGTVEKANRKIATSTSLEARRIRDVASEGLSGIGRLAAGAVKGLAVFSVGLAGIERRTAAGVASEGLARTVEAINENY